jgi:hypothetical protein
MGGHTFIREPTPDVEEEGKILRYLMESGVTTFDVTLAQNCDSSTTQSLTEVALRGVQLLFRIFWG